MIFADTGRLTDFFYVLGNRYFPTHLFLAPRPMLFEAGLSCLGPLYVDELRRVLGRSRPRILFLTHVHYDHCGAAGLLQQAFPELKIAASAQAAAIVQRPNARATIADLNRITVSWMEEVAPDLPRRIPFEPFAVDLVLGDGDRIEIDKGVILQVIETPGHTWDALSYYIPSRKLLVAGEAVGCMAPTGSIYTEFLVDFEAYIRSMERLARLDVDILCQSHHQVFTGEDARTLCARSIKAAMAFRQWVERLLHEENGQVEKVADRIKAEEYDPTPGPKQPEQAYRLNLAAKVKHLAEKLA